MPEIAVLDDETTLLNSLGMELSDQGYAVHLFGTAHDFSAYFKRNEPDAVLLDLRLPDADGLELLKKVKESTPKTQVIIITAHGNMESAISALKGGAFDYISKPFDLEEIGLVLKKALKQSRLVREVEHRRQRDYQSASLRDFIGQSNLVKELLNTVGKLSQVQNTTILLKGESGTGKDLLAKAIHNMSARASKQFIEINCASLPDNLLESELFGYEKGAFTDARQRKTGLVELADQGTLFLDEVAEMPLTLQAKLLRFLETRSFRRIGGGSQIKVDVMIISATNRDLDQALMHNRFRPDLYYRLNVVPLTVPPLRKRGKDILLLTDHYLTHFSKKFHKPLARLDKKASQAFLDYRWPGNIRELKNLVERLVILCSETITLADLPTSIQKITPRQTPDLNDSLARGGDLDETLSELERQLILEALNKSGGVKSEAARLLGISRFALARKMKRLFADNHDRS
ncbi:sigma-54-dependent transcriptional regulator [Dethiosulfatarculus sandiegensis]|uniref:Response regulator n=1 Tax=Dethiosulfatarculus sandiegensis TaxID=1429043 RepID=A0A0D2GCU0_9BACT|nr:sigma-54 dependent transcriptional regulator [Dethiosulfatarculus sandiegensis]KIX12782.1 response regulator [Dethiosulfatarculus sandiegensis]